MRVLRAFSYFKEWTDADLASLNGRAGVTRLQVGDVLFEMGGEDWFDYFLIEGEVSLQAAKGPPRLLGAKEVDAGFPISYLRPRRYTVTATRPCHLLRVEGSALRSVNRTDRRARFVVADRAVSGTWQDHPMWTRLLRELGQGTLPVPSLPAIALRVQMQLARMDVDLNKVTLLIQTEPSIAGKLLKVANSALMRHMGTCPTVHDALMRLGFDYSRQMVTAFAAEQLFNRVDPRLRTMATQRWQHSVEIASLAMVLARLTPPLQPERALLAGLMHDIGVISMLSLAQEYPDLIANEAYLQEMIDAGSPKVSAAILTQWGLGEQIATAALHADDWFRDGGEQADYADVLIVAHLHALVRKREFSQLPRMDDTPAFKKLALGELSPKLSLLVLDESRGQIQEMRSMLG